MPAHTRGCPRGDHGVGLYTPDVNLLLVEDQRRVARAATATFSVDDGSQDLAIGGER